MMMAAQPLTTTTSATPQEIAVASTVETTVETTDEAMSQLVTRIRGRSRETLVYLPYLAGWRQAAGWSRDDLACASDVARSTIRLLEMGARPASFGLVTRLARALGIANGALVYEQPPRQLAADHAFGSTYYIAEANGELLFTLTYLSLYLRSAHVSIEELAARTGLDAGELALVAETDKGAPYAWAQRIAAALAMPLLRLIGDAIRSPLPIY